MSEIHVFGASDDLIEIEGAIAEEFDPPYGKPAVVVVQAQKEGVQHPVQVRLRVEYGMDSTAEWRITEIEGHGLVTIAPARGEDAGRDQDGCPGYSDKATVRGGFAAELDETEATR